MSANERCTLCAEDRRFLRRKRPFDYSDGSVTWRVVDLFSGCGGLSLGLGEAARRRGEGIEVALAADVDEETLDIFKTNLPVQEAKLSLVEDLFDGALEQRLTSTERSLRKRIGKVDLLVGGPPCQGHSDLNNHTRRRDKRNAVYSRMARAAKVLEPRAILIENVPTVLHDHGHVVEETLEALEAFGFDCSDRVIDMSSIGVPQRRRRHVVLALAKGNRSEELLSSVPALCEKHVPRTVRWAIDDLTKTSDKDDFHSPSSMTPENARRIAWLFENRKYDLPNSRRPACHANGHSYVSMYGRLRWDDPAQTITTGFGSMGQGRYVHPGRRRTLTPREAARLQTFPDFFDFGARGRGVWARSIGNAVPPLLNVALGSMLVADLRPRPRGKA